MIYNYLEFFKLLFNENYEMIDYKKLSRIHQRLDIGYIEFYNWKDIFFKVLYKEFDINLKTILRAL